VARAQGERGTGMSRFASRARRHSDFMGERFGWTEQANCRSWQFGRRSAGSLGMLGAPASCRLSGPRRIQEGKENSWSHGTLLCGPDAGETPAFPGGGLPKRLLPGKPPRGLEI
ncbi:MAG: hypothetical protein, partial [Olavius algarvensis Gamma 1 endosymbiont]